MYSCVHMYHSRILLDYLTKIEFKTGFVILEARASRIQSQNLNPTRSTKNNLLLHNDTVLLLRYPGPPRGVHMYLYLLNLNL